jgi:hypothetical protein
VPHLEMLLIFSAHFPLTGMASMAHSTVGNPGKCSPPLDMPWKKRKQNMVTHCNPITAASFHWCRFWQHCLWLLLSFVLSSDLNFNISSSDLKILSFHVPCYFPSFRDLCFGHFHTVIMPPVSGSFPVFALIL